MVGINNNVSIDPNTQNPTERTTPEHKIKLVRAHGSMVAIIGIVGDKEVENIVDRVEAIQRAQALSDMVQHLKYASEVRDLQELIEQFIVAIKQARINAGSGYKSKSVSMFIEGKSADTTPTDGQET